MNNLQIFKNAEFGEIRTVQLNNETYFVGKDVAEALGYSNPRDAIARHVETEDKADVVIHDGRQNRTMTTVNESGLYSLILSSKLPNAKRFKHWVTSEVLPSIRKTGGYIAGQETMTDAELMARAVLVAQRQIEERNAQIKQLKGANQLLEQKIERDTPKVIFADAVSASDSSILVRDLAKIIRQNGVDMGEKRLYKWLREHNYICKSDTSPTQRAMEMGLFEVMIRTVERGNGLPRETRTTLVTGKGQVYFTNKLLSDSNGQLALFGV